jgi:hypothetical protein
MCVNYECEVNTITDQDCDNGLACDGQEICSEGNCVGGEPVDCSQYNLPEINTCTYDPDGNSYTLDYRTEFTSVCQEPEGPCSAAGDITHTCDEQCGAGCTSDEDCDDDNPDTIDRCSACQCTHNQTPPVCGNEEEEEGEECDGADGVTPGENFCTVNCQLVPIYDGLHSCPEGTVRSEQALWSGTISGTDPDGEFIDSGITGQLLFEATGTFVPTSSPGYLADAGYTTIDGTLAPQYGIQGTDNDFAAHALLSDFGTGIIGLIDWGEYNPDHIYTKYYDVAAGDGMQFVIGDRYSDWFNTSWQNQTGMSDNEGSLNLNIYECQETTPSPYCGDGTCNGDESCETCPQDCGECFTSGGGGHYHAAAEPEGEVLGEATTCGQYLFGYIEYGADNNPIEVMKLQFFLNEYMGSNLAITTVYDEATRDAVNAFQLKYGEEILQPWIDAGSHCDTNTPTGYVFITTQRWINLLKCPILNIPIADLSGFDKANCGGYSEGGQEEGQVLGEETQPSEEESAGVSEEVGLTTGPSEEKPSAEEKGSSAAIGTFFTWGNFWWLLFALIVILACIYFLSKRKKGIKE